MTSSIASSKEMGAFAVTLMQIQEDGTATASGWIMPLRRWDALVKILATYGTHAGDTLIPADRMPTMLHHIGEGSIEL